MQFPTVVLSIKRSLTDLKRLDSFLYRYWRETLFDESNRMVLKEWNVANCDELRRDVADQFRVLKG